MYKDSIKEHILDVISKNKRGIIRILLSTMVDRGTYNGDDKIYIKCTVTSKEPKDVGSIYFSNPEYMYVQIDNFSEVFDNITWIIQQLSFPEIMVAKMLTERKVEAVMYIIKLTDIKSINIIPSYCNDFNLRDNFSILFKYFKDNLNFCIPLILSNDEMENRIVKSLRDAGREDLAINLLL